MVKGIVLGDGFESERLKPASARGYEPSGNKVPWLIRFIVDKPFMALFIFATIPIGLSVIGMLNFTIEDLDGWDVSSSLSSRSADAFNEALDIYGQLLLEDQNRRRLRKLSATPTQTIQSDQFFHVYYLGNSLLDYESLNTIRTVENEIYATAEMERSCLKYEESPGVYTCSSPLSITRYLPNSEAEFNETIFLEQTLSDPELNFIFSLDFLPENFAESTLVTKVRSSIPLGVPRIGYNQASESVGEQNDEIQEEIQSIVEGFVTNNNGIQIIFDFNSVSEYVAFKTVVGDAAYAIGSLTYVCFFIGVHTGSVFMAVAGMSQILLSFPTTYFFYRMLFGIEHFATLQVLAIFVILGIGADDIFVFYDAYRQSKVVLGPKVSRHEYLYWAYRKAAVAMLLTSLTTFTAFLITALSAILNIRVFGIFAGLLVLINYVLCITILPALIIIYEDQIEPYKPCMCWCCCRRSRKGIGSKEARDSQTNNPRHENAQENQELTVYKQPYHGEEDVNAYVLGKGEKFYRDIFAPFVIRNRYVCVVVVLSIVATIAGLGIKELGPSDKLIEDIFPEDHFMTTLKNLKLVDFGFGESGYPEVQIMFGVNLYDRSTASLFDPRIKGVFSFYEDFNFSNTAQLEVKRICNELENATFIFQPDGVDCWINEWEAYAGTPVPIDIGTLDSFLASPSGQKYSQAVYLDPDTDVLLFFTISVRLGVRVNASITERLETIRELESYLDEVESEDLGRGIMYYFYYTWWETQETLVITSQIGLLTGITIAFAVLAIATTNIRVAILSISCIACVVLLVIGMMGLIGWDLGFMEAVSIVCLVGLAVDYVVHLSVAYVEFQPTDLRVLSNNNLEDIDDDDALVDSRTRTQIALTRLGVSIIAGATTTFGASIFLLLCTIQYLGQFGSFLAMVISSSLVTSHFLLPALLAILGPTGEDIRCQL